MIDHAACLDLGDVVGCRYACSYLRADTGHEQSTILIEIPNPFVRGLCRAIDILSEQPGRFNGLVRVEGVQDFGMRLQGHKHRFG